MGPRRHNTVNRSCIAALSLLALVGCAKHKVSFRVTGGPYTYGDIGTGTHPPCALMVNLTIGSRHEGAVIQPDDLDWRSPEYGFSSGEARVEVKNGHCQGPVACEIFIDGVAEGVEHAKSVGNAEVTCSTTQ